MVATSCFSQAATGKNLLPHMHFMSILDLKRLDISLVKAVVLGLFMNPSHFGMGFSCYGLKLD